ncbi:uncharacterized protein LOC144027748 isoform X2 [Festucalex cinctus]
MPGAHCSVRDCHNGLYGLKKWMKEFCHVHHCNKGTSRCTCDPPYVLIPFPTERKAPERRAEWTKLMNRKNKTGKNWDPTKNSRVCSVHFVDGAPSTSFPNPTLKLGYSAPSTSTRKKRAPPKLRTSVTVQARKRQKLNVQNPSTEETHDEDPSDEDASRTSGRSDPGTDVKTFEEHVDHTYTKTTQYPSTEDAQDQGPSKVDTSITSGKGDPGTNMFVKTSTVKDDNAYDDNVRWTCSQHQRIWMKTELQDLGLWPGCRPVRKAANAISLWRFPPQPELLDPEAELPSPNVFQLHPFFIWKPEHEIMARLRRTNPLPCLHGCPQTRVVSDGVKRPQAIAGIGGQYYILSSQLRCEVCHKCWFADSPLWLKKLPKRFTNILPAFFTAKKAICKTVTDELRRAGKSPSDMAGQVNATLRLRYERARLAYLHTVENAREAGEYGQTASRDETMRSFGSYEESEGWCGVSVTEHYLTDRFLEDYTQMETESVPVMKTEPESGPVVKMEPETDTVMEMDPASGSLVKTEPESVPVVKMEPESVPVVKMEPESIPLVQMAPSNIQMVEMERMSVGAMKMESSSIRLVKTGPTAVFPPATNGMAAVVLPMKTEPTVVNSPLTFSSLVKRLRF